MWDAKIAGYLYCSKQKSRYKNCNGCTGYTLYSYL
jgi:hypothetical protein